MKEAQKSQCFYIIILDLDYSMNSYQNEIAPNDHNDETMCHMCLTQILCMVEDFAVLSCLYCFGEFVTLFMHELYFFLKYPVLEKYNC